MDIIDSNESDSHYNQGSIHHSNSKTVESVLGWFDSWQSWQRNLFLSSILNSFSMRQLRGLESSIEAIFHKDFLLHKEAQYGKHNINDLKDLVLEDFSFLEDEKR